MKSIDHTAHQKHGESLYYECENMQIICHVCLWGLQDIGVGRFWLANR